MCTGSSYCNILIAICVGDVATHSRLDRLSEELALGCRRTLRVGGESPGSCHEWSGLL
jgi:hypothetical protein